MADESHATRQRVQGAVQAAIQSRTREGVAAQADAAIVATLQTLADEMRAAGDVAIMAPDLLLAICGDVRR